MSKEFSKIIKYSSVRAKLWDDDAGEMKTPKIKKGSFIEMDLNIGQILTELVGKKEAKKIVDKAVNNNPNLLKSFGTKIGEVSVISLKLQPSINDEYDDDYFIVMKEPYKPKSEKKKKSKK